MICPNRTLISVRIIVPFFPMASRPVSITLQLILELYMIQLHLPPRWYTLNLYLADYMNTLNLLWFILHNNTNPSGISHINTWKVLLPPFIHYHHDPTLFSLCIKTITWLLFMIYHALIRIAFCIWTTRYLCAKWAMSDALHRGRAQRPANRPHEIIMTTEHATS